MKPHKTISLTTCLFALWLAAPLAKGQSTNALEDLSVTNGVMLSYRTLDALKYTPDGRLAMIYWVVDSSGLYLDLIYNEQQADGTWIETVVGTVNYRHYDDSYSTGDDPFPPVGLNFYYDYAPPSALLFDSQGNPHVVYADFDGQQLVHYAFTPSGWQYLGEISISMLNADDCFAAAIGPGDVIHVVAGGDATGWQGFFASYTYTPVHYCWIDGAWQDQTSSEGSMMPVSPSDYSVQLDYEPRPFSMVVDASNYLHIAYCPENVDTINSDGSSSSFSPLAYMSNESGQWTNAIVYSPPDGHSDAGLGASIAIASNGEPAIASFFDPRVQTGSSTGGSLFYSERGTNGVWTTSTVANSANGYIAGDGNTGTGFAPHLLFDYAGRPHIVFTDHASEHVNGAQDEYGGNVRHAWLYNGAWQIQTVYSQTAPVNNQCFFPNFAMSPKQLAVLGMVGQDEPYEVFTNGPYGNVLFYLAFTNFVPANYLDTTPPTLTVAVPTANQDVTNWPFMASGTANDPIGVENVFYQVNGTGWNSATTTNSWTNWTATPTLSPGTNILEVYAEDKAWNFSTTNTLRFAFNPVSPYIMAQPVSRTNVIGSTATFAVSATGLGALYFQWQKDGANLVNGGNVSGATSSNLTLSTVSAVDAANYDVVITNASGSATSDVASLTVLPEPNIWGISNNPSSGTMTLSLGSYPNTTNYIYATTNLLLPLSQWQLIATNVADTNGLFQFIDPATQGVPAKFYTVSAQIWINSVSPILPEQYQTITITGSGLGTQSPYNGDSDYIYILDVTGNWEAGYSPAGNYVTLDVTSWTDNQIVISGFTGYYGDLNWTVNSGDNLIIAVWNPQTGVGPATNSVTVGP